MSLSNSERQEMEMVVRAAIEPALHDLECRIAEGFAKACDMWANLIADIMQAQAAIAMEMRDVDREKFFKGLEEQQRKVEEARAKVGGFAR